MLKILFLIFFISVNMAYSDVHSFRKVFPFDYKVEGLDNGLTIIFVPMQNNGIVSYYSVVRTGSRDEYEPGHSGFAHFFEHCMFRGTKKHPGGEFDSLVTLMGASANAYTSDDLTCYHLTFAKEDLEQVIELESDRFQNLFYQEREFQTESGAVLGEFMKSKTSPWFLIEETMLNTAFDLHTYKHTTMGFEADIRSMPTMYDYSRSFFNRYYRPENVVILIVGDVNAEKILPLIKKYYGDWKKGYEQPKIEQEPEQKAERNAKVIYSGKNLPILAVAYKSPAYSPINKVDVAAGLIGDILFGQNSEIYKKLYLNEQLVQRMDYDFGQNRDPGLWSVYCEINDEKNNDYVLNEIDHAIDNFKISSINEEELDKLKKRLMYSFLMSLETSEHVAGALARVVSITGGINCVDQYYNTMLSLTPKDFKEAALKYFNKSRRTVVTLRGSN
ncbi:MAG: pitrilysin family protein [Candidatus Kapabacteria bacterium]|nr:pitrilysin family protein [Candidatus Kapabacteria bacterium]